MLSTSPDMRLKLPVEYKGVKYGEIFVACEPRNPTHPGFPTRISSARLAKECGELLHVLEESALLSRLCQRIDLTLATRSLSREPTRRARGAWRWVTTIRHRPRIRYYRGDGRDTSLRNIRTVGSA